MEQQVAELTTDRVETGSLVLLRDKFNLMQDFNNRIVDFTMQDFKR